MTHDLKTMKKILSLAIFASLLLNLDAQENVSNADLSRKLDLILNKVDSLDKRVTSLEKNKPEKPAPAATPSVEEVAKPAPTKPAPTPAKPVAPQEPKEKKSFFQKIKQELKRDEALAAGPWTNPDTWKNVRKSMTSFKVRQVLGNPNKIKNSVNPRIERVYRYEGDLDGDGVEEEGVVNFHRDRVVSFESPFEN